MSASWVAASVRGRALARRRLGAAGARQLATEDGVDAAVVMLAESAYGHDVRSTDSIELAEQGVAAAVLWHLRVLGGWVPRSGAPALRALAAGFEVANVEDHLAALQGRPVPRAFQLGSFATAWPRLAPTTSVREVRTVLTASAWGDPGSDERRTISLYLRATWFARVARAAPLAEPWAAGALALLLTRELMVRSGHVPEPVVRASEPLLGVEWSDLTRAPLGTGWPRQAAWAVQEVTSPTELWLAEAAWWRRVERDAFATLRGSSYGLDPVTAAVALLAVDAWRVRAALETAAGQHDDVGLFDAVA
jgi:hypothetical protein